VNLIAYVANSDGRTVGTGEARVLSIEMASPQTTKLSYEAQIRALPNSTGSSKTLEKGQAVYIHGYYGNYALVEALVNFWPIVGFVERARTIDFSDSGILNYAKSNACPNELRELAAVTYSEIGGGDVSEMRAVAHSVLNRKSDPYIFPNDLHDVITQRNQYEGYRLWSTSGNTNPRYTRATDYYSSGKTSSQGEVNAMLNSLRESVKAYYDLSIDNTNDATVFWQSLIGPNWDHNFIRSTTGIPSSWVHTYWIHSAPCICGVSTKTP